MEGIGLLRSSRSLCSLNCSKRPITLGPQKSLPTIQTFPSFYRRGSCSPQRGGTCPRSHGELYSSFPLVYLTLLLPAQGIEPDSGQETLHKVLNNSEPQFPRLQNGWDHCPNFLGPVRVKWDKACRALNMVSTAELFLLFYLILAIALWGTEDLFWFACLFVLERSAQRLQWPAHGHIASEWIPGSKLLYPTSLRQTQGQAGWGSWLSETVQGSTK